MVRIFALYGECWCWSWSHRVTRGWIGRDGRGDCLVGESLELRPELAQELGARVSEVGTGGLAGRDWDVVEIDEFRGAGPGEMSQHKPERQDLAGVELAVVTPGLHLECCLVDRLHVTFPGLQVDNVNVVDKGDFPVVVVIVQSDVDGRLLSRGPGVGFINPVAK